MFERIAAALPRRGGRQPHREEATGDDAGLGHTDGAHDAKSAAHGAADSLRLKVPNVYVLHEQPAGATN